MSKNGPLKLTSKFLDISEMLVSYHLKQLILQIVVNKSYFGKFIACSAWGH